MDEQDFLFRVLINFADMRAALWSLTAAVWTVVIAILLHAMLTRARASR